MATAFDDLAVDWLLWVRNLRGLQARGTDVTADLAGLIGPEAKADVDMEAHLDHLADTYGAL